MSDFLDKIFPGISVFEKIGIVSVLCVAVGALVYAVLLVFQTLKKDKGTKKMQDVANLIKLGANAYLKTQFKRLAPRRNNVGWILSWSHPHRPTFSCVHGQFRRSLGQRQEND